jgi:hypothetical protein
MQKTKNICPLLRKPCIERDCAWWTHVRGVDKNTGKEVDDEICTVTVLPMLLIENSAQQRSTSAAVESFRNESVARTETSNALLLGLAQQAMGQNAISPVVINELPSSLEQ